MKAGTKIKIKLLNWASRNITHLPVWAFGEIINWGLSDPEVGRRLNDMERLNHPLLHSASQAESTQARLDQINNISLFAYITKRFDEMKLEEYEKLALLSQESVLHLDTEASEAFDWMLKSTKDSILEFKNAYDEIEYLTVYNKIMASKEYSGVSIDNPRQASNKYTLALFEYAVLSDYLYDNTSPDSAFHGDSLSFRRIVFMIIEGILGENPKIKREQVDITKTN